MTNSVNQVVIEVAKRSLFLLETISVDVAAGAVGSALFVASFCGATSHHFRLAIASRLSNGQNPVNDDWKRFRPTKAVINSHAG